MNVGDLASPRSDDLPRRARPWRWRWLLFIAMIGGLVLAGRLLAVEFSVSDALDWIGRMGPWGPLLFVGIYVGATTLFVPGSVMTAAAGATYGLLWGIIYASVASTLGAVAAFLLSRYLIGGAVARRFAGHARFVALDQAITAEGWKIVGLTRLSPILPFTVLNYAFGLTRIRLWHYVLASWIGMVPGTVMYVYLGSAARAAATRQSRSAPEWIFTGIGLLATIAVTWLITRIAKRALAPRMG